MLTPLLLFDKLSSAHHALIHLLYYHQQACSLTNMLNCYYLFSRFVPIELSAH